MCIGCDNFILTFLIFLFVHLLNHLTDLSSVIDPFLHPGMKIDAKEMEQLLREGAYSVLLEDDADLIREFCEQDIDKLLEQRAHVLVTEGGAQTESWLNKRKKNKTKKSAFTGESSMEYADIDVNDPDFWKKVLGSPHNHVPMTSDH